MSRGKRIQLQNFTYIYNNHDLLACEVVRQPLFKNVTDQIRRFRLPPRGGVRRVYAGGFQTAIFPKQMQTPIFSPSQKHLRVRRILGRRAADTKRLEPFVRSSGGGRHAVRPIRALNDPRTTPGCSCFIPTSCLRAFIRQSDAKRIFQAVGPSSARRSDDTDARKATVRCFGRSDRSALRQIIEGGGV